tara:strand:- start:150 stop:758 length:609 start_codon:yes stop_codon:yes gene_type:complete
MIQNTFSTSETPKRAIIAIHGWTGNVESMEPIARALNLPDTHWVIPQAPYKADKGGYSWFGGNEETGWQYQASFDLLSTIIHNLNNEGFSANQIFMLSFSQGACLTMEFMIRQPFSLGGIIPIAGFIRYKKRVKQDATDASHKTPILLLHGEKDKVILPDQSKISLEIFKGAGYQVDLQILSAGHKIPLQAKSIIKDFILSV